MSKRDHPTVPGCYPVCVNDDCSQAATCLRQIYYEKLAAQCEYLNIATPQRCSKTGGCKYYRDSTPVTFARGFTNFQRKMYPEQYVAFKSIIMGRYGRTPFYERRRGDYALPPSEQKFILSALRRAGVTEDLKFDSYEERIDW